MNGQKEKKFEKKPSKEGGEKFVKVKAEGATAGLALFDYSSTHRLDARQFNEACKQMVDYAAINFGEVSKVLEFNQEVNFDSLNPASPKDKVKAYKKKKAELEFMERERERTADVSDTASTTTTTVSTTGRGSRASTAAASSASTHSASTPSAREAYIAELESLAELELEADLAVDKYKKGLQEVEKIKRKYDEDKIKMYGVLYGQLTNAMRHRLQEETTFDAINIHKGLLDLWKLVRKVSLEERGCTVPNAFKRLDDARTHLGRVRQFAGESIGDFNDRFLTEVEAFEAAGGTFTDKANEITMMFIQKLDRKRYGSILIDWENRLTDGDDVYPKTIAEALRRIGSRKTDDRHGIAGQGVAFAVQEKSTNAPTGMLCYFCKQPGHKKKDCALLAKAFQQFEADRKKCVDGKCAATVGVELCDEGVGFVVTKQEDACDAKEVTYSTAVLNNNERLEPFDIHCDSQSNVNLFKEKSLLKNIRPAMRPLHVAGISGQKLKVTQVGDLGDFGEVYYHPDALVNILCFSDLASKYKVSYNSDVMDAFVVTTDKRTIIFEPKGKLYVYNPMKSYGSDEVVLMMSAVEDNKRKYTNREVKQAELAHDLYVKLARPALNDFVRIVREGRIMNCPITVADIRRWVDIFGIDIGTLKGRTTRDRAPIVNVEPIPVEASKELTPVVMAADIMYIEGVCFFVGISRKLDLITIQNLKTRHTSEITTVVRSLNSVYKARGYRIDTILSDGEGGLKKAKIAIGDLGIKVNLASKGEHVPEVERTIRQVKERVRSFHTTLPYKLDELLVVHLVYYCVAAINSIPRSGDSESPREQFTGVKIDYLRDCKVGFGEYVQVHEDDEITNTMKPRTNGALALGPVGNAQGSYKFLMLSTWKVVQRRTWTSLPISQEVIKYINNKIDTAKEDTKAIEKIEDLILARQREVDEYFKNKQREQTVAEESSSDTERSESEESEIENDPVDATLVAQSDENNKWKLLLRQLDVLEEAAKVDRAIALTTMSIRVGLKKHGQAAMKSLFEELKQLYDKDVFEGVDPDTLSREQMKSILSTLLFMKEKRDGRLKSRLCVNGSKQDPFRSTVDPSSPTVLVESIFLSLMIDALEERIVKTADIEGAYLVADMPEEVLVMFDETLAAAMLQVAPEFSDFERFGKLIFRLKKALYGCIQSARLFYEHLRKTLIGLGFEPNPYDPCVFNKVMYGKQCTILIYVDDLKISCKDPRGVDETLDELRKVYKKLSVKEGKKMDYLGMLVDFTKKGVVKISMIDLIDEVLADCPVDKSATSPAASHLFEINPECPKLSDHDREVFHSIVAKLLYIAKRGRPDILLAVIFLTTRVKAPDLDDQKKLIRLISYLKQSRELVLTLGADDIEQIKIYIDASHAVHEDAKSHTGVVITMGTGAVFAKSSKQKLVSKSSTAAELIALSDGIDYAVWAQEFMRSQGYNMKPLIIYQDNKSTIILAEKGKSTNQRTRHINIRYFAVKDLIDRGEAVVIFTPTEEMKADYMTKPLQGRLFVCARKFIMGLSEQVEALTHAQPQGCVG